MLFIDLIKRKIDRRIREIVRAEVEHEGSKVLSLIPQLVDYSNCPPDRKQSYHDHSRTPLEDYDYFCDLRDQLVTLGIAVEDISVDIEGFDRWLQRHPEIMANYEGMGNLSIEKCLEHYLSYTYLDIASGEVFIDVAAAGSPYVDVLNKRSGIKSYRLDLCYPEGIHGKNIGADAGDTKLPADFAGALALHCAFECFMGEADWRFIGEASRLLKPGGRLAIVPLYLDATYFNATSPFCDQNEVTIDQGAMKVWRDDNYKVPFSRHYSPAAFFDRIYSVIPENMAAKILFVKNLPDVMRHYNGQRSYCYFMLYCEKDN